MILLARWTDNTQTKIEAVTSEGKKLIVPVDDRNRHYRMIIDGDAEQGIPPVEIGPPRE